MHSIFLNKILLFLPALLCVQWVWLAGWTAQGGVAVGAEGVAGLKGGAAAQAHRFIAAKKTIFPTKKDYEIGNISTTSNYF